jgi:hypothetical protein
MVFFSFLRVVNNSCALVLPCFHLSWIFAEGLEMVGWAFLSTYLYKSIYTSVHRNNLLPLILNNCPPCFGWGPRENNGYGIDHLFLLKSKMSEREVPLKKGAPSFLTFFDLSKILRATALCRYSWCKHYAWERYMAVQIYCTPVSVHICAVNPGTSLASRELKDESILTNERTSNMSRLVHIDQSMC